MKPYESVPEAVQETRPPASYPPAAGFDQSLLVTYVCGVLVRIREFVVGEGD